MINQIEEVIAKKIRPYLSSHQGDIELLSVLDGVVRIRFLGKCKNCPSAQLTVEEVVEKTLKEELPSIYKVVIVNELSQELLDMAKKLLNKKK